MKDLKKGIVICLFAWFCFSSMYTVAKLLGEQTNVPTMLFFRNIFGILIILPWILKDLPKNLEVKNVKLIIARSIVGLLNLCFIFLAIQHISLVDATLLNNTAPLIVPFVVWTFLKIPLDHKMWPAIVVGFIGVALILQPTSMIFNLGALYALLSGICLAISLVTMRLSSRQESFQTFMFYFFAIGLILTAPFALANWKIDTTATLWGLLAIGFFSALGQLGLYFGLRLGKARQLAPISYASVVFAGIYEWIFWGIVPEPIFYIGMTLIVAAGIWVVFVSRPPKSV